MTYCLAILLKIKQSNPDLKLKEARYTASSLIVDAVFEGQEYTIEIKPKAIECQHKNCVTLGLEKLCLECGRSM